MGPLGSLRLKHHKCLVLMPSGEDLECDVTVSFIYIEPGSKLE